MYRENKDVFVFVVVVVVVVVVRIVTALTLQLRLNLAMTQARLLNLLFQYGVQVNFNGKYMSIKFSFQQFVLDM